MSIDQRLSRLAPVLTAQERAILVLESWKDGRQEQPSWRHSMPREQARDFNWYIEQMNRANVVLGKLVSTLSFQAREIELRWCWLLSLRLWEEHIDEVRAAVRLAVQEPITESAYNAAVEANRDEWVPVEELAAFLAGHHEFGDDAFDEDEEGHRWVKDEAFDPVAAEEEKKLRQLAREGVLSSRGRGRGLKLQERAIMHFGYDVGAVPEECLGYRVVPDAQADAVEVERRHLDRLNDTLGWRYGVKDDDEEFVTLPDKLRKGLTRSVASQLSFAWIELRCVDALLTEIADTAFNGIDPLKPVFREKQEATRAKLLEVRENLLTVLKVDVVLREPLEEELDEMRGWLNEMPATS